MNIIEKRRIASPLFGNTVYVMPPYCIFKEESLRKGFHIMETGIKEVL